MAVNARLLPTNINALFFFVWKLKNFLGLVNLEKRWTLKQKKILVHHGSLHVFFFSKEKIKVHSALTMPSWIVKIQFFFPKQNVFFLFGRGSKRIIKAFQRFFFFIEACISIIDEQWKKKLKTSFFQIKFVFLLTNSFQYDRIKFDRINVIWKIGRQSRFFFLKLFLISFYTQNAGFSF